MPSMKNLTLFSFLKKIEPLQLNKGRSFCGPEQKMQNLGINFLVLQYLSQKVVATVSGNLHLFGLNKGFPLPTRPIKFLLL